MNTINDNKNPFFSVIIPCYNSKDTIERLLDSLVNQKYESMEVIIQDDNSTDNFMELVEPYKSKLNIKYFKNKPREIHCPGNTRNDGIDNATGEWITFIDHDDMFEDNIFIEVVRCIQFNNEPNLLVSEFKVLDFKTNEVINEYDEKATFWLHGKFYNRKFLLDNNIRFKDDLITHEDHYFNQLIFGHLALQNTGYSILKEFTYRHFHNPDSFGQKLCVIDDDGLCFIDKYYDDYLKGVADPLFELYERYPNKKQDILIKFSNCLLFAYFYYQSLFYRRKFNHYQQNREIFERYLIKVRETLGVSNDDIIKIVYADSDSYNNMRDTVIPTCGDMIEYDSFATFINRF